ncbi:MAG: heavy metal-binding domain-containing protein [Actinomycetota bacterium]|nr:heavy metal-binding domain-containing protein [Actinomycetota bacterium]
MTSDGTTPPTAGGGSPAGAPTGPAPGLAPSTRVDVAAELRAGMAALAVPPAGGAAKSGTTSDLSVDEVLLLHAAGWEPVALVAGYDIHSIPTGWWGWGSGEITVLTGSASGAFRSAEARLRTACAQHGAAGVVGVRMELEQQHHTTSVQLIGTAIRRIDHGGRGSAGATGSGGARGSGGAAGPFLSDLSARDFVLLQQAGWSPLGIAFGASHIYAPYRPGMTALRQATQNVELTNFTEAMYAAREAAMGRMQGAARAAGGSGVVGVSVTEGPMRISGHAIRFLAWGTIVALHANQHRRVEPLVTLSVNDQSVTFQATSLRAD